MIAPAHRVLLVAAVLRARSHRRIREGLNHAALHLGELPTRRRPRGAAPLTPQRKWRAITIATLVLVPAFWSMLAGFVAVARDEDARPAPAAGPAIALGLALIPFVFIALAFLSEHPRAPVAVVKAMGLHAARRYPRLGARGRRRDRVSSPGSAPAGSSRCAPRTTTRGRRRAVAVAHRRRLRVRASSEPRAQSRCCPRRSSRSRASGSPTTSPSAGASAKPRALERRLPRHVRLGCRDLGVPDRRRRRSRRARRRRSGTRSARRRARCTAVRTVGSPPIIGGAWPRTSRSWPTSVSTPIGSRSPGRACSRTGGARRASRASTSTEPSSTRCSPPGSSRWRRSTTGTCPKRSRTAAVGRHERPPCASPTTRVSSATRSAIACRVGRRSTNRGARRCSATARASTRPVASTRPPRSRRATTCCSRTASRSMRCARRSPAHPRSRSR